MYGVWYPLYYVLLAQSSISIIWWVRRWCGWILHECVTVFSRATGEWKYSTLVQYPAILPSHPSNNMGYGTLCISHWLLGPPPVALLQSNYYRKKIFTVYTHEKGPTACGTTLLTTCNTIDQEMRDRNPCFNDLKCSIIFCYSHMQQFSM